MKVDMDKLDDEFWASGQAPNNYGRVVREQESCGAHLIVVDSVLQPLGVDQLPQLQTEEPINDTTWAKLLSIINVDSQLAAGLTAALPQLAPAPAPAWVDGAPAPAPAAGGLAGAPAGSVGSSSAGSMDSSSSSSSSSGGSGWAEAAGSSPAPHQHPHQQHQHQQQQGGTVWEIEPSPPAPPGVAAPPDCATLAATGQLMRGENGSLATNRCQPSVTSAVLSSGGTQTVISDARQKANSLLVASAPSPPAPPASGGSRALAGGWAATLLAAALTALWLGSIWIVQPS
jgi:hypothetical protein